MADHELVQRWRELLAARAFVPEPIRAAYAAAGGQPPRRPARADTAAEPAPPGSRSLARALEALPAGGTVLDVGAGAGGASLPLADRAGAITGVDTNEEQLEVLAERGRRLGVEVTVVRGAWPDVAGEVPAADIVTCHHVLYHVPDLPAFAAALTNHARRRVVVELPERHPQAALDPLWRRFHGLERPDGPSFEDALAVLRVAGVDPHVESWVDQVGFGFYERFDELADHIRRRLFLPPERTSEVAEELIAVGVDPKAPRHPGTVGRRLVTLWW